MEDVGQEPIIQRLHLDDDAADTASEEGFRIQSALSVPLLLEGSIGAAARDGAAGTGASRHSTGNDFFHIQ